MRGSLVTLCLKCHKKKKRVLSFHHLLLLCAPAFDMSPKTDDRRRVCFPSGPMPATLF